MSAKWPTTVATDADLSIAVNSVQTTLASNIDSAVTSIPLISTSGFPAIGYVTIDNEVISYTGVAGGSLTGATRGADGTTAASHLAAAPVGATIVAAHHNSLKDEVIATETWLDLVLGKATTVTATVFNYLSGATSNIQAQLNALLASVTTNTSAVAAIDRLRVTAQSTPGTTVAVAAGVYTKSDGTATVTFAGGSSPAFSVVSANSRIDLLTIDDSGVLAITQGTQAASPAAPAYPSNKIVLAQVTISQTTGPAITQAMIKDVRPYLNLGGGGGVTLLREDYVVGTALNNYTGSLTVFNLVNTYNVGGNVLLVALDGDLQTKGASADYLETSSTVVTFNNALVSGQRVSLIWSQTAPTASGVVNAGTAGQLAYYAATGAVVSGGDYGALVGSLATNILDNAGFKIWQRGTSFTNPASGAYIADRWQVGKSAGVTVNITKDLSIVDIGDASIKVDTTVAASTQMYLIQNIENFADFKGKTVSFSCRIKTTTANKIRIAMADGVVQSFSAYHTGSGNFETLTMTFTVNASASTVSCYIGMIADTVAVSTFYAVGAMLVPGSSPCVFTPTHPQVDLARCQRFYQVIGGNLVTEAIVTACNDTTTVTRGVLRFPVVLRTAPTITAINPTLFNVVNAAGGALAVTVMGFAWVSPQSTLVTASVASGLVAGNASMINVTSATAFITASADL